MLRGDSERDLTAYADLDEREWYAKLQRMPNKGLQWRRFEWQSSAFLIDEALDRVGGFDRNRESDGAVSCKILEVGFGVGRILEQLTTRIGVPQEYITGIELLDYRVDAAKKRWPKMRLEQVGPTPGDVLRWFDQEREKGESYHLVMARNVLQCFPWPERIVRGIARVLPEGGVLGMMVPPVGGGTQRTSTLVEMAVRFEDQDAEELSMRVGSRLPVLQHATTSWVSDKRRWRLGWATTMGKCGMEPVAAGECRHGPSQSFVDFYLAARRNGDAT